MALPRNYRAQLLACLRPATKAEWRESAARFRAMAAQPRGARRAHRSPRLPPTAYSVTLRRIARLCDRMGAV